MKSKKAKLDEEYNEVFDGTEQLEHVLQEISDKVHIVIKNIPVDQLVLSEFKKQSRTNTRIGLAASVEHWGVLSPIHVLQLEDENTYMVLDGLRRVVAAIRTGVTEVQCAVWHFDDVTQGKKYANILALMLNRQANFDVSEQWSMLQLLEEVNEVKPALAEYLLNMASGEAMKLKDVMLCEAEYAEVQEKLLDGSWSIEQAYKKLCNLRKKENKLEKEDNMAVAAPDEEQNTEKKTRLTDAEVDKQLEIGGTNSTTGFEIGEPACDSTDVVSNEENTEDEVDLATEDIDDLLNTADNISTETADEQDAAEDIKEIDKTDELRGSSLYQKVGQRHPIDPNTRTGTFIRDGFKCRCCGLGGSEAYLSILAFHHAVPVSMGGPDTKENGLTLCVNCHIMLHNYLMGKLQVDFDLLPESERQRFKRIIQFGNIALEASKKKKMSKKQLQEVIEDGTKHPMYNKYLGENTQAYNEAKTVKGNLLNSTEATDILEGFEEVED